MINSMMWGILLIILGLSLIVKTVFGISIPFIRMALGGLFVYAGITLITGMSSYSNKQTRTVMFKQETVHAQKQYKSYNILFGNGIIDLSRVAPKQLTKIEINVLFGLGVVKLSAHTATKIIAESFLGGLQLPDESVINWGKKQYTFSGTNARPLLEIHAKAIFGNLIIEVV
jgi:hypothetical protein